MKGITQIDARKREDEVSAAEWGKYKKQNTKNNRFVYMYVCVCCRHRVVF